MAEVVGFFLGGFVAEVKVFGFAGDAVAEFFGAEDFGGLAEGENPTGEPIEGAGDESDADGIFFFGDLDEAALGFAADAIHC